MTIVRIMAVAAVATSLACSEGVDRGQLVGPEFAKGKPNLNTAQVCEAQPSGDFFSGLAALCVTTANTEFTSTNADRDRRGLIARLNRAGQKCSEDGNVDGTVDKLTGFRDKVVSLRVQG